MENKYDFEVKIAQQAELIRLQAAEIERVRHILGPVIEYAQGAGVANPGESCTLGLIESHQGQAAEIAALKQAGVIIPGPITGNEMGEYGAAMRRGYDACRREVARLNASRDEWPKEQPQ